MALLVSKSQPRNVSIHTLDQYHQPGRLVLGIAGRRVLWKAALAQYVLLDDVARAVAVDLVVAEVVVLQGIRARTSKAPDQPGQPPTHSRESPGDAPSSWGWPKKARWAVRLQLMGTGHRCDGARDTRQDHNGTQPLALAVYRLVGALLWPIRPRDGIEMVRVPVHPSEPAIDGAADLDGAILAHVRFGGGSVCADAFCLAPFFHIVRELLETVLLLLPLSSSIFFALILLVKASPLLLLLPFPFCSLYAQPW